MTISRVRVKAIHNKCNTLYSKVQHCVVLTSTLVKAYVKALTNGSDYRFMHV